MCEIKSTSLYMQTIRVFIAILVAFSITSCATTGIDPNDPNTHLIQGVKQTRQGPMQCGAASLLMVLQFNDIDASMNQIDSKIRERGKGTSCWAMQLHSEDRGLRTDVLYTSDVESLKSLLSKDILLVARVYSESRPTCHYVVLVGYTDKGFIINDPTIGQRFKSYEAFKKWHACDYFGCGPYWTLAVYK